MLKYVYLSIRVPGVGEKEPAVEKGDEVRVKIDNRISPGVRRGCFMHPHDEEGWMTLEVKEADRDTIYIIVRAFIVD